VNCFTYALVAAGYTQKRHNKLITENGRHPPEEEAMIRIFSITTLAFTSVTLPHLVVQMFGF
jgi:hypothetical protein